MILTCLKYEQYLFHGSFDYALKAFFYLPLYLVDEHAREDTDENTDDRDTEESPQTRVQDAVDDVAVLRPSKNVVHSS